MRLLSVELAFARASQERIPLCVRKRQHRTGWVLGIPDQYCVAVECYLNAIGAA